jgi:Tfp pilus assembly PilM family ATPase
MARLIAIDLGAWAARVSVWNSTGREAALEGSWAVRVPQDGTEVPGLPDRLAALDSLLRAHGEDLAGGHLVEVAWPASRTALHRLTLPFTETAQIEQTLPFAIEAEVPFDLDELLLAWRPAAAPGATPEDGAVMAALAREADVTELVEALAGRGLDPRRVVPEADALAAYARGPEVTAILDVGHASTTVAVAARGVTLAAHSVDVGGRAFTRAIQRALDATWAEAEALKHGLGAADEAAPLFPDDPPDFPGLDVDTDDAPTNPGETSPTLASPAVGLPPVGQEALNAAVALLLAEVRATLVQAEDDLRVGVERIVLCGGGSRLPNLAGWLEADLGLPVEVPRDSEDVPVPAEHALARAVADALASRVSVRSADFRVGDLAFRGGLDLTWSVLTYGFAGLGTFLAAVVLLFAWNLRGISLEQGQVDARLRTVVTAAVPDIPSTITSSTELVAILASAVGDLEEQAGFLGTDGDVPDTVDLLYKLTAAFPPHPNVRVDVDSLEITQGAILINGQTDGFAQVDSIASSLAEAGHFDAVDATPGNKDSRGKLNFTVNIARDGGEGDTDAADEEG